MSERPTKPEAWMASSYVGQSIPLKFCPHFSLFCNKISTPRYDIFIQISNFCGRTNPLTPLGIVVSLSFFLAEQTKLAHFSDLNMNFLRAGSSVLRYTVSNLRHRQTSAIISSGVKRHQPQRAISTNSEHDGQPQPPSAQDEQEFDTTVSNKNEQSGDQAQASSSEVVKGKAADSEEPAFSEELEKEREWVDMWNNDAPSGPEWGGPRGYEPTRYGDWTRNGRVTDF